MKPFCAWMHGFYLFPLRGKVVGYIRGIHVPPGGKAVQLVPFFVELKRRNVLRVTAAYLAAAWLVTEAAALIFPIVGVPASGLRIVMIAFALGFLPALLISWFYELTPDGIMLEKNVVRERSITYITAKRLDIITICMIVLAMFFVVANHFWFGPGPEPQIASQVEEGPGPERVTATSLTEESNSIAVLPFVNMSDDDSNEYFSDGISEELLNLLSKIPELRVISRSSAFYYKGAQKRLDEIARELQVAHILEGSVRKVGNQVRITAQLIDARTDTHLWSEVYDRDLEDIFAIQDEIAGVVTDQLRLTLLGDGPRTQPVDPQAYSLYLQARYLNSQTTKETLERAIGLYQEAVSIDPSFARAWRGMAVSYMNQANKALRPMEESYLLARQAVETALEINPEYAMGHAMLGMFAMTWEGDLAAAALHLQYALSLEPTHPVLLSYASSLLLRLNRLSEAVAIRERDVRNDPLDPIGYYNLAFAYLLAGQLDKAELTVHTLIDLAPNYGAAYKTLGKIFLQKGEYETALEMMLEERSEFWQLFGLSLAYHALGRQEDSDAALDQVITTYGKDRPYDVAKALAYQGDANGAFQWLEQANRQGDMGLTYLVVEPCFSNIRSDHRWEPLLVKLGLAPEYLAEIEFRVDIPDSPDLQAE